eukprot:5861905-Pyramimonas_sp.AAC.1
MTIGTSDHMPPSGTSRLGETLPLLVALNTSFTKIAPPKPFTLLGEHALQRLIEEQWACDHTAYDEHAHAQANGARRGRTRAQCPWP